MPRCTKVCWKNAVCFNLLSILTFTAVIFGVIFAIILKASAPANFWTERRARYVGFFGEVFLLMMTLMIVPLISSTIIQAVGSVNVQYSRIIAFKGGLYYISMTLIAVVIGITLVATIEPGHRSKGTGLRPNNPDSLDECGLIQDNVLDILRSLFPPNVIESTIQMAKTRIILKNCLNNQTCYEYKSCKQYNEDPNPKPTLEEFDTEIEYLRGPNFMGIIVYSTTLAIALVFLGEAGRPVMKVISGVAEATLKMTTWITWISPIGIASLIAGEILKDENLIEKLYSLSFYILTVLSGFAIHGMIVLPLVFTIFTKKLPFKFILQISKALLTAFGTSSSSATVPVTIQCLEQNVKIDPRVVRFLIPMGSALNLAGTALYEAVGAIYIAQVAGKSLSFIQILLVSLTSTLASIGAAGVPAAGTLTMVLVLKTIQLDPNLIYLVIALDWILDRFQTVVNVLGDAMGVAIVYHWTEKKFKKVEAEEKVREEEALEEKRMLESKSATLAISTVKENSNSTEMPLEHFLDEKGETDQLSKKEESKQTVDVDKDMKKL